MQHEGQSKLLLQRTKLPQSRKQRLTVNRSYVPLLQVHFCIKERTRTTQIDVCIATLCYTFYSSSYLYCGEYESRKSMTPCALMVILVVNVNVCQPRSDSTFEDVDNLHSRVRAEPCLEQVDCYSSLDRRRIVVVNNGQRDIAANQFFPPQVDAIISKQVSEGHSPKRILVDGNLSHPCSTETSLKWKRWQTLQHWCLI